MSKHKHIFRRLLLGFGASLALILPLASVVNAQSVPHGYQSDQTLQNGMIIRLKPGDGTKVQAVTQTDESEMFGVVVSSSDAAVSLSSTSTAQETFVANAGQYGVLVSTQNGPIKAGDYIGASSLGGVGMKANSDQQYILGKALSNFDGKTTSDGTTALKTSTGDQSVSLGRVTIEVAVAHNPAYHKVDAAGVPTVLASLAQLVTDKPVTAYRIYASLAIIVLSLIIAGVILFAGVRSGMTAVGRNPLAKKSIFRNLIQVTLMALIVFVIGVIAVYLLLRV